MSLPSSWTPVLITGTFARQDTGAPATGYVDFVSTQVILVEGIIVEPAPFRAQLAADGTISILLPSTNAPSITPKNWTYAVVENVVPYSQAPYNINVPYDAAGGTIDLSTVAHVNPPTPMVSYVVDGPHDDQIRGVKNGVASEVITPGGGGTWGSITGTLSDQTDLQNALNAIAPGDAIAPIIFSCITAQTVFTAPYNGYLTDVCVAVQPAFDGVGAALSVGIPSDHNAIFPSSLLDPTIAANNDLQPVYYLNAGDQVWLQATEGSGATQGAGLLFLRFLKQPAE